MADWLPECFPLTPEGTWRPPVDEEECAQEQVLRATKRADQPQRTPRTHTNPLRPLR